MLPLSFSKLDRVLCLGAHADDIEIGCGGTVLQLQQQSPDVHIDWMVLSSTETRKQEALASANRFLKTRNRNVQIGNFPDRYFPAEWKSIKDWFAELGKTLSGNNAPDLILTHRLEDRHQDHRVVAELTWNAFRDHAIWEYEIPKFEGDLGQPNTYVPLARDVVNEKVDGLMNEFASQHSHPWYDAETFRSLMRIRGLEVNAAELYAEAFTSRKTVVQT